MLFNTDGKVLDFDLLQNLVRQFGVNQLATTARTSGVIIDSRVVDFVRMKRRPFVAFVSWLSASLAFGGLVFLPLPFAGSGLAMGFTISPDGGLEEFDEFFFALASSSLRVANSASSLAIRFSSRSHLAQSFCLFASLRDRI